jgi:hypothetical protein
LAEYKIFYENDTYLEQCIESYCFYVEQLFPNHFTIADDKFTEERLKWEYLCEYMRKFYNKDSLLRIMNITEGKWLRFSFSSLLNKALKNEKATRKFLEDGVSEIFLNQNIVKRIKETI